MGTSCARGRCARPGRTLRACRLITALALEFRRKLPSLPCGVLRGRSGHEV